MSGMDNKEEARAPAPPPPPMVPWPVALAAGGAAGTTVDVALFPLDTIKTRLQAAEGFWRSGGLSRIYAGLGPVLVGSAPGAAVFFCAYEAAKAVLGDDARAHATSAAIGEVAACSVRVPVEVVKQRRQARPAGLGSLGVVRAVLKTEGPFGLYRGYWTTVAREVPFSLLQFPLWERLKSLAAQRRQDLTATPVESAACGALAGALSAAATTPLDVAKTRIMLSEGIQSSTFGMLSAVYSEGGARALFAGVAPRTLWISLGGFLFFGAYEQSKQWLLRITSGCDCN